MAKNIYSPNKSVRDLKILIVGRTASGKDSLAEILEEGHGMTQVLSYTTRPKRYDDEKTHVFITSEEAANINDKVAYTRIGEYEYFATKQQVEESDIYIIDPPGMEELFVKMPDTDFLVVQVDADRDIRMQRSVNRQDSSKSSEEARRIFDERDKNEDKRFLDFERTIMATRGIDENGSLMNFMDLRNSLTDVSAMIYLIKNANFHIRQIENDRIYQIQELIEGGNAGTVAEASQMVDKKNEGELNKYKLMLDNPQKCLSEMFPDKDIFRNILRIVRMDRYSVYEDYFAFDALDYVGKTYPELPVTAELLDDILTMVQEKELRRAIREKYTGPSYESDDALARSDDEKIISEIGYRADQNIPEIVERIDTLPGLKKPLQERYPNVKGILSLSNNGNDRDVLENAASTIVSERQRVWNKELKKAWIRDNPACFPRVTTLEDRDNKEILQAFLEGLMEKGTKDLSLFRNVREFGVPSWFRDSDEYLTIEANFTGLGYAHIKESGKSYLISEELIANTIDNLHTDKEKGIPIGIEAFYMFVAIPDRLMTRDVALDLIELCPYSVVRLPEKFHTDDFFREVMDDGFIQWFDAGDMCYGGSSRTTVADKIFSKLSEGLLKDAVRMMRSFFNPVTKALLNDGEIAKIYSLLPQQYKHLAKENSQMTIEELGKSASSSGHSRD